MSGGLARLIFDDLERHGPEYVYAIQVVWTAPPEPTERPLRPFPVPEPEDFD